MRMLASIRHLPPYREAGRISLERLVEAGNTGQTVSAWNPIGGFSDAAGGLIWYAVATRLLLGPHQSTWMAIASVPTSPSLAQPGESFACPGYPPSLSRAVSVAGSGRRSACVSEVDIPRTHVGLYDGTAMAVADLLYPYSMAVRWGTRGSAIPLAYDSFIDGATAVMRTKLAGVKVCASNQEARNRRAQADSAGSGY